MTRGLDAAQGDLLNTVTQYLTCLDTIYLHAQDLSCYPFLSLTALTVHVLQDIPTAEAACTQQKLDSLRTFEREFNKKCSGLYHGKYDSALYSLNLNFSLYPFFGRGGTTEVYEKLCRTGTSISRPSSPCAAIFAQWGMQRWVLTPPRPQRLLRVTGKLLDELPAMPESLKKFNDNPLTGQQTDEDKKMAKELRQWREDIRQGVCSDCMWRMYVDRFGDWGGVSKLPADTTVGTAKVWIVAVHRLYRECGERGREFWKSEMDDLDESWRN